MSTPENSPAPTDMKLFSLNPTTGEHIAEYATMTEAECAACLDASVRAFDGHRRTTFADRARKMTRAAEILESQSRRFAVLMTREMGKPVTQAEAEARKCALVCRYYAERAAAILRDEVVPTDAAKSYVTHEPLGPILAVMPWNFPFWQVFRFAAPALMAGNTALLKHAPNTTGCALAIEEIMREAGFADGVFQTLRIAVDRVAGFLSDPRVKAVTLTGSGRAGKAVGGEAGAALKPSVLELGGSDPFIVLADADLDRAVEAGLRARMQNNGQSCIAGKRFILEAPIAETYVERFTVRAEALRVGDPLDENTDLGPMARADLRAALHAQVERTVAEGARIRTGGINPGGPGFFYPPTVLTDVAPSSLPFREELFGPVAAMIVARDADDAIRLANETPFGLGGTVFTEDREKGESVARRLEVGCAFVNSMVKSDPRLPFGGIKASGYGRELSHHGLHAFVNAKTVWVES